jgi:hypothetical protein
MTLAPVLSTTLVDFADILQYVWIVYVRVVSKCHPVRGTERGGSHAGTTDPNALVVGADDDITGGARLTKTTTWFAAICGPFPRFAYPTLDTLAKCVYIYRTIRTLFVKWGAGELRRSTIEGLPKRRRRESY